MQRVLAIELLTAAQALEFRKPKKTSPALEKLMTELRKTTSFMAKDTILHEGLIAAERFLDKDPEEVTGMKF